MKAKRTLALMLALCMVLTMFAVVPVSAADTADAINDAVILDLDFSDFAGEESWTDETGNLTVDTSAFDKGEGRDGASALKVANNGTLRWHSDQYDPFAQCADGITMVLWLKSDQKANYTHFFNYKKSPDRGLVLQAGDGNNAYLFRMSNKPNGNWDNLGDNGKYPGNGNWMMLTVTQDATGQAYIYINGEQISAKKFDETVTPYLISQNGTEIAQYNFLGPTGPGYDQWSGDAAFTGVCQQASMYNRALTAEEILYLYDPSAGADLEKIEQVKSLIEAAKTAEAGTAAQIDAYRAAVAGYDELNPLEKAEITNYGDLEAVKASYVEASGVILGFDFDGNYDDVLSRVSLGTTDGYATLDNGAMKLDGTDIGDWTKICGFVHNNYRVFDLIEDDVTIEMKVNANSYVGNAIFSVTWGWHQYLLLQGGADNKLQLRVREQIDGVDQDHVLLESAANALIPGQLQTITLVQYKGEASIITEVYVDGNLVIRADSVADRVKGLSELSFTHDDIIMIGASDLGNSEGGRNLFSGSIDSCYIYNYAKTFEADYSKVDEAIASTEELVADDYTASSWKALQDVIAGVDRTLTVGQQDVVDAYADAIYKAVANLITKDMELNITISDGVATESDKGDSYKNVTWNATITLGDNTLLSTVNEVATFKAYGVIYGMNDDAVQALANGEETKLAKKVVIDAAEGEEGIDVYTAFGFRLKNMAATGNRSAMFYVTYEANGQTYTIYSPMGSTPTAE